jgi:serine/threonine protein kinase
MDELVRKKLMSPKIIPKSMDFNGTKYYRCNEVSSGKKGVVWHFQDRLGKNYAIKIVSGEEYQERSYEEEAKLRIEFCDEYPEFFSTFYDVGVIKIKGFSQPFVFFIEKWIEGLTLKEFLKNRSVDTAFLRAYIRSMGEALNALHLYNLCHNDLHPGNIKITQPRKGLLSKDIVEIKIIDTGNLKKFSGKKPNDDHLWFVQHIIEIRNSIIKHKKTDYNDRKFLNSIKPLLVRMAIDNEATPQLTKPDIIVSEFESLWREVGSSFANIDYSLNNPFDYISAEFIQSDKLLIELFAESCPWLHKVYGPDQLLLTGPRGCGKSTLFRRLSLKVILNKSIGDIINSTIAGFYISCGIDLHNRFHWINNEVTADKLKSEIIHYFNLIIIREICRTLYDITLRSDRESVFGFGTQEEIIFHNFIMKKLYISDEERQRLQGIPPIEHAKQIVDVLIEECYEAILKRRKCSRSTPASLIADLTTHLNENIHFFQSRKIVFFIDDLSTRIVPGQVQFHLNDIFIYRGPNHVFKISSDKFGWEHKGELFRDFDEFDVGDYYVNEVPSNKKITFTLELINKRLQSYKDFSSEDKKNSLAETYIGHSSYEKGSLGKEIVYRAHQSRIIRSGKLKKMDDIYYGIETITDLCAADISNLLEVFRRILSYKNVNQSTSPTNKQIPKRIQNKAIVSVSKDLLEYIKTYDTMGSDMYSLVIDFGELCQKILYRGKPRKREDGSWDFYQTTRIELPSQVSIPYPPLREERRKMQEELIKRGIFIDIGSGFSKKRELVQKVQLKPMLCPAFGLSLSNNTSIMWSIEEFRVFLRESKVQCDQELKKGIWKISSDERRIMGYIITNRESEIKKAGIKTLSDY